MPRPVFCRSYHGLSDRVWQRASPCLKVVMFRMRGFPRHGVYREIYQHQEEVEKKVTGWKTENCSSHTSLEPVELG